MQTQTTETAFASYFKTLNSKVILADSRPEWMQDAVREAHCGMMPNDWVYEECRAAFEAVDSGSLNEDSLGEWADGRVDVYTKQLAAWYADFCLSDLFAYAEETAKDCGMGEGSINENLMKIQYFAIESIAGCILNAVEANKGGGLI